MPEIPEQSPATIPEIRARLRAVARLLQSGSLDPESQRSLADLVAELGRTLEGGKAPAVEVAHLAESTAHLTESLHQPHDHSVLGDARDRLERAAVNAEARAPFLVGLARKVMDTLANIGI